MKICLISNLYKPHTRGGAENIVDYTANEFQKTGHEVVIISTKPDKGLSVVKEDKIVIYRFKPLNLFYYLNDYKHNIISRLLWHIIDTFNFWDAKKVFNILKTERPDVVITHNLKGISLQIPRVIKKIKVKHIHILHDVQLAVASGLIIKDQENSLLINGFVSKIYQLITKRIFYNVDIVISPSKWLLNFYKNKGFFINSKNIVIPNPVNNQAFSVNIKTNKQNNYIFVGQIEKHKGIEWLINLWQKNNVKANLIILGKGTLAIKQLIKNDRIQYLGVKYNSDLITELKKADFLILPSLCYENSPTVIPLAYQNATSVIVANIGGAGELVDENETGYLFEAGNEKQLSEIIQKTQDLSNQEFITLSQNCLNYSKRLNLNDYIKQLESLF